MYKRTLSPSSSSRRTRASTLAILPDVDPEHLMRQTKRMRITSQVPGTTQTPTVDASRRALDTIKDRYQSGPSRDQQSSHLDDQVIEQYFDFEGGAGPSATGENLSPAKSVESEHGTVVENQNSPGNKSPVPPSDYSEGLVELPHELGHIFHAPCKVPVNDKLNEALDRFRETNAIKPTVKWFKNAGIVVGARTVTSKVTFVLEHELCAASVRYRSLPAHDQSACLTQLSGYIHLFTSLLLPLPSQHLDLYKSLHLISANYAPPTADETLDHLTSTGDPTGLSSSQPVAGPSSSPHTPLPRNVIRIPASAPRPRANSTTSNF
ncbi:hypothetical protein TREMEDRAFT_62471 [Tremella mesenterica DSM 1558]|uniref:uncharacterized protein n=1 Tax=Tremella mesenterica (strain ATCC 24925 / CBS 8224 / DSM 1558 / NBRC 9311 / NRRL Y-6157 / RJB 2259-6 / UBC 559-6) TaxID=578456 RepID=UPI0003F4939E|nr:uncharacterized protein TREMEDRAFT_62471 [Tremella mesenterica DSM 1558]EIW69604.1 hypothetical protein TREMEDRAFT_62471 [Tremella mesenterica DSM 1558]